MPKSSPRVGGLSPEGLASISMALPRHSLAVGPLHPRGGGENILVSM